MNIGVSTSIFKYEPLPFILKVASYLEMNWIEIKTDYLHETRAAAAAVINSKPEYSTVTNFSIHSATKGVDMVDITPEQIREHEADLDLARTIGADRVIFHAGYSHGKETITELEAVVKRIHHYLDYTEGTDILILLENTMLGRNKLCSDPKQLAIVLEAIAHERLGATLDISNLLQVKEDKQKKRYKRIQPWVRHIQVNSKPVFKGDFKIKKFVKFFLKDLKMKKHLKRKHAGVYELPVIIEGKTSLAKEMYFVNMLWHKLK